MCEPALRKKEKRETYDENKLNTYLITDEPTYSGANGSVVVVVVVVLVVVVKEVVVYLIC